LPHEPPIVIAAVEHQVLQTGGFTRPGRMTDQVDALSRAFGMLVRPVQADD
jgi:hypothetical protein